MGKRKSEDLLLYIAKQAGYLDAREDPEGQKLVVNAPIKNSARSQLVFVKTKDTKLVDHDVVTFYAYCLTTNSGAELQNNQALIHLLIQNWEMPYGKYALISDKDQTRLAICCDQLLDTLDPEEFDVVVRYVSEYADRFEERLKKDQY